MLSLNFHFFYWSHTELHLNDDVYTRTERDYILVNINFKFFLAQCICLDYLSSKSINEKTFILFYVVYSLLSAEYELVMKDCDWAGFTWAYRKDVNWSERLCNWAGFTWAHRKDVCWSERLWLVRLYMSLQKGCVLVWKAVTGPAFHEPTERM